MTKVHIVGHDGGSKGEDALALARAMAPTSETRRVVAHVIERPLPDLRADARFFDLLREDAKRDLGTVRDGLQAGEELRIVIADSRASGLQELAASEGADLVVVGSSGHSRVGRAFLGTTADHLLHGSPCPVAAAAPDFAARPLLQRLLVAYDGRHEAEAALRAAVTLAQEIGATVDVLTARPILPPYAAYSGAAGMAAAAVTEADALAKQILDRAVATVPEDVAGAATVTELPAGRAITETAAAAATDLIVLGSRAYGPVKRVLLGSTGRHVLHHAPCSVLVLPRVTAGVEDAGAPAQRAPASVA